MEFQTEPSFYSQDVQKYAQRFQPTLNEEKEKKKKEVKVYQELNHLHLSKQEMRVSSAMTDKRSSNRMIRNASISSVDFDNYGNTESVSLIFL